MISGEDTGNACHLQQITAVKERIAELNAEAALRAGVSIERVLNELAKIGFADMGDLIKAGDKLRALEGLGRHLGMFVDKTEPARNRCKLCRPHVRRRAKTLHSSARRKAMTAVLRRCRALSEPAFARS